MKTFFIWDDISLETQLVRLPTDNIGVAAILHSIVINSEVGLPLFIDEELGIACFRWDRCLWCIWL